MNLKLKKQSSLWIIAIVLLATIYNVLPSLIYYSRDMSRPLQRYEVEKTAQFQADRLSLMQKRQEAWLQEAIRVVSPKANLKRLKEADNLFEVELPQTSAGNSKTQIEQSLAFAAQFQSHYFPRLRWIPSSDQRNLLVSICPSASKESFLPSQLGYTKTSDGEHPLNQAFKNEWKHQIEERLRSDSSFIEPAHLIDYLAQTEASQIEPATLQEKLRNWRDFETCPFKNETKKRWAQWMLAQFHSPQETLKEATQHLNAWVTTHSKKESNEQSEEISASQAAFLKEAKSCLSQLEKLKSQVNNSKAPEGLFHPIISSVDIDPHAPRLTLNFYADAIAPKDSPLAQALEIKLYEISSLLEKNDLGSWAISSTNLEGTWSCSGEHLVLWNVASTAKEEELALRSLISLWSPLHPSLQPESFKIYTLEQYLSPETKTEDTITCLVIDTLGQVNSGMLVYERAPQILVKGFELLLETNHEDSAALKQLQQDFTRLASLLATRGYDLLTQSKPSDVNWNGSALFCKTQTTSTLLQTSGLDWKPLGMSSWMSLDINDYGSWARLLNNADDKFQQELLQSIEDIRTTKNQIKPAYQALVITPKENPTWENTKLAWRKMLRGDSKRIVKWGLDLSGGRTVRVSLSDEKGDTVTDKEMLLQARNELIQRVNRMGLSEVAARLEGDYLVLDFPGSQGYSSKELIQATRLSFHVVNEKFSSPGSSLFGDTQEFLNQVWSQAQIQHKMDKDSLNALAISLLEKGASAPGENAVKRLLKAGFTINPRYHSQDLSPANAPSMIVPVASSRGAGQIEGLLVAFSPAALQGSDLSDVRASFDPQHGNILTFEVRSSARQGVNPQETFHMWTRYYSQNEAERELLDISQGRGWRMAVIMNDVAISSPTLSSGLKDQAMVYGRFTQREVARLAADLKAGSLSFSPKILSEENISPELGLQDREMGMKASMLAMVAVGLLMIGYYGFAGVIAFVAVIANLLIIWAVLQNLGAALTLPGLAGIVLTVGMAVDANVLVFERLREELKNGKNLREAIKLGYERAFSAIVDSNLTTILAALILIQFDSGPIKGFAMSLIIGIASSMFTALFMTRVFFEGWAERKDSKLELKNWIGSPKTSFLKQFNIFTLISAVIAVSGLGLLVQNRHEIIGMDFVGGYGFYLEPSSASDISSKEKLVEVFKKHQLKPGSFDVRELGSSTRLKVYLSHALDEPGALFHGLSQQNERIEKVLELLPIQSIEKQEIQDQISSSWSDVSGQLSQTMRNQALLGLFLALLGILVYLTVRFEWTFALTGVIALIFDVVLSIGCMGWLKAIGLPMQFDLQAIGAIMTIIGYALNDKIIVFDRIREEKKGNLLQASTIESALRHTLGRTLMTSGTTLIVLLVLDLLGGSSLLSFSMIMTLGVLIGTLSSLWFAPWVLNKLSQKAATK